VDSDPEAIVEVPRCTEMPGIETTCQAKVPPELPFTATSRLVVVVNRERPKLSLPKVVPVLSLLRTTKLSARFTGLIVILTVVAL
jgi:hypothetical protein